MYEYYNCSQFHWYYTLISLFVLQITVGYVGRCKDKFLLRVCRLFTFQSSSGTFSYPHIGKSLGLFQCSWCVICVLLHTSHFTLHSHTTLNSQFPSQKSKAVVFFFFYWRDWSHQVWQLAHELQQRAYVEGAGTQGQNHHTDVHPLWLVVRQFVEPLLDNMVIYNAANGTTMKYGEPWCHRLP